MGAAIAGPEVAENIRDLKALSGQAASLAGGLQVMLGHKKLETTAIYARVSPKLIQDTASPFEQLALKERAPPA